MPGIGDLFAKGSIAEQFLMWNVLSQLSQGLLAPVAQSIANATWSTDPNAPLPPAIAADMVARGKLVLNQGEDIAAKSGISAQNFAHLVDAAKHAPPFTIVVEAVRRGLIGVLGGQEDGTLFAQAMADMGINEEWWDVMSAMVVKKPTGEEGLQALLQGQIERPLAERVWREDGNDPDWFQHAFDSQGTAPTPDMAGTMANRGIIPWEGSGPGVTSFEQAFLEGPWRNKWLKPMRGLMEYLPPPRTVTALVHEGSISDELALQLWQKMGLSLELAQAYLKSAHHSSTSSHKELARADIEQLYLDKLITQADAAKYLAALGYPTQVADLMLKVADTRRAQASLNSAVSRLRTLYTSRKITKTATLDALHSLGVPAAETSELLAVWDIQQAANIRQLTPAQIENAWYKEIITQAEAESELQAIGYTPWDAWLLLSIKNGEKLPGEPPRGAGGIGVLP